MLTYLGNGNRDFGKFPHPIHTRKHWEFWAIIKGTAGVLFPEGSDILHSKRLWLFPPMHAHGWIGDPQEASEVAIFHFTTVPAILQDLCESDEKKFLEIPLTAKQCRRLRKLALQAAHYRENPSVFLLTRYQYILLELCLIIDENFSNNDAPPGYDRMHEFVERAIAWYTEHMHENPSLKQIAANSAVSETHLRRAFHITFGCSPHQITNQLRFERATQMMINPTIKLDEVAESCGFQSSSAFSRSFKAAFGCSPAVWRGHYAPRDAIQHISDQQQ